MSMVIESKERLFSVKDAARELNVTPGRVRQLVLENRIKAIRLARDLIIPESEVRRYARERRPYRKSQL